MRVLIANRGEIAVRGINACRQLGLESVSVYSTADRESPHVWMADRSVCVGPPSATQSYLNIDALLQVATALDCGMVYPGYGFLAENPVFVERCEAEAIKFVGPTASCIRQMGDKAEARRLAAELGVSVVPGSAETFVDRHAALKAAGEIGFPLLLKATAGGGGRGMRVVDEESQFNKLFDQASSEAREAFSNPDLYIERYFPRVRHLEVQVFADQAGTVRHLGERDCTTQRRHQKLMEEAPCPVLERSERQALLDETLRLVAGVGYEGAGTVEFIFDETSREFFFIEMNTRIQVEHPVTEQRTGHDLVAEQLRIAMGQALTIPEESDWPGGHVMEFRINAEDGWSDFRPSPGLIRRWREPQFDGIRIDGFVREGMTVQPYYDSMLAKLIVSGADRSTVLARARRALDRFEIEGIKTTVPFHRAMLDDADFIDARIHTRWVDQQFVPSLVEVDPKAGSA